MPFYSIWLQIPIFYCNGFRFRGYFYCDMSLFLTNTKNFGWNLNSTLLCEAEFNLTAFLESQLSIARFGSGSKVFWSKLWIANPGLVVLQWICLVPLSWTRVRWRWAGAPRTGPASCPWSETSSAYNNNKKTQLTIIKNILLIWN